MRTTVREGLITRSVALFDKDSIGQWVQRGRGILSIFPDKSMDYNAERTKSILLVDFVTLPSELYGNDERSHVPVWVVFTRMNVQAQVTMFFEWDRP